MAIASCRENRQPYVYVDMLDRDGHREVLANRPLFSRASLFVFFFLFFFKNRKKKKATCRLQTFHVFEDHKEFIMGMLIYKKKNV